MTDKKEPMKEPAETSRMFMLPKIGVLVVYGDMCSMFSPDGPGTPANSMHKMQRETIRGLLKGALAELEAGDV